MQPEGEDTKMPYWTDILRPIVEAEERKRGERIAGRKEEREYGFKERELAQRESQFQRGLSLEERQLKQQTINNAYKQALDVSSDYLERWSEINPDDKNPSITARAMAGETFDNFMASAGYPEETFIKQIRPEREEIEREPEEVRPPLLPPTKPILPETAPPEARAAERGGQVVRGVAGRGAEAVRKLPSQAVGLGSTLYNLLAGGVTGVTGIPQRTIGQPYLDVMRRGELFNVPRAIEFYKDLLKRPKTEADILNESLGIQRKRPGEKQIEKRLIR